MSPKTGDFPSFIKDSVYRVLIDYKYKENIYSSGAGFFISKERFLTCFHVVFGNELINIRQDKEFSSLVADNEHDRLNEFISKKLPQISVELHDGTRLDARLSSFNETYDIALLDVETGNANVTICQLDFDTELQYGEQMAFGGFPNQHGYEYNKTPFAYHEGMISSFPTTIVAGGKYEHLKIHSINLYGNSGAPLYKKNEKKVIGIVNGNMNWGRDDIAIFDKDANPTSILRSSLRVPLSIAYATTMKTLAQNTSILK